MIAHKSKQYREVNKEKIKQKKNEKNICVCGSCYTKSNQSKHEKTKKHIQYMESQK